MGLARTVGRYAAGGVLVMTLIAVGFVVRIIQVGHLDQRTPADALVVLGAAQYNGTPSPVFKARLDHAAELYRQQVAPRVITIGGNQPGDAFTEGAAGRAYLAAAGVPESALVGIGEGDDTLVSLRAAAVLLTAHGWNSVVLVTDPWHSARAAMMARDLGLAVQTSPVTSGPAVRGGVEARYVLREMFGIVFYRFTGGSSGAGSAVL